MAGLRKAGRPDGDAGCGYARKRGAAMEGRPRARTERLGDGGLAELRA